jgi:prolyl 4-hydroxylase
VSTERTAADELSLAEQCDSVGDHDNAVNALARATQMGDVEGATRLGKRLVVGRDAPLLPRQGTGFLIEAFNRGGAEAAARLAVLAAAGVYVQGSLAEAFRLIAIAATRGWQPAQQQLLALSPDRALVASASREDQLADSDKLWQELSKSIDAGFWQSAPNAVVLSESPRICSFPGFLPEPVCAWLIGRSAGRLQRALVYDASEGQDYESETRTNSWAQFDLMDSELIHLLVQTRMQAACGIPLHHMEANAILHYAVGEEISDHFDFVDPKIPNYAQEIEKNGQRVLTFLIYLNDDYAGGETEFCELGIRHRGQLGEGLFFVNALENNEPDLRTLHAGHPPTRGEKWIVSQFVRSRRVLGVEA